MTTKEFLEEARKALTDKDHIAAYDSLFNYWYHRKGGDPEPDGGDALAENLWEELAGEVR